MAAASIVAPARPIRAPAMNVLVPSAAWTAWLTPVEVSAAVSPRVRGSSQLAYELLSWSGTGDQS